MRLLIVSLVLFVVVLAEAANVYNVMDSGAIGDGSHDDSQAFGKAWQLSCGDDGKEGNPTFSVPGGRKFLLKPIVFSGPCKSNSVQIQIDGILTAPTTKEGWVKCTEDSWLRFEYVKDLVITGSGTIDGQGQLWWNGAQMQGDSSCSGRPSALHFHKCDGFVLTGLHHMNPPKNHISVNCCRGATLSNFYIVAPEGSPNTDGIDISNSSNLNIHDASIQTGDDCIAMNHGTSYVNITRIACGPGHGISIGSLGEHGEHTTVEHIHVQNCSFFGTTNGARIKTYQGVFEDITLENTKNPIIIDQFYNNFLAPFQSRKLAPEDPANANLVVQNVTYTGFRGTSGSKDAIALKCDLPGCRNIIMNNVNITPSPQLKVLGTYCRHASVQAYSTVPKVQCLR